MLELALSLPLFLAVILGTAAVGELVADQCRLALVTHAITREVVLGTTDPAVLSDLANAYGGLRGTRGTDAYRVALGEEGAGALPSLAEAAVLGTRVTVRRSVPLRFRLGGLLPRTVEMSYASVVLVDAWKNPFSYLHRLIGA